jgi:hypothetical protein
MYIPYFYLIRHTRTGKLYAGSRYGKGANPTEFMTEFGYQTSSPIIHRIIAKEGLSAFETVELTSFATASEAYSHETVHLVENNARTNPLYYNKHENEFNIRYDDTSFKQMMIDKYGHENAFAVPEFQDKIKETLMEKYGVDHPSKSPELLEKKKSNFKKKYGVENPQQVDSIKNQTKKTCIDRYGVDNIRKSEKYKEENKKRMMDLYGVDHNMKVPEIKLKQIKSLFSNYGVTNPSQSEVIKDLKKQTLLKNYGVDNWAKTDEAKNLRRQLNIEKSNRPVVKQIKEISRELKIKMSPGWQMKPDEVLLKILDELTQKLLK